MARKSKIVYYPNLTIKENAAKNGVSMAGMNYYIRTNNIDRRRYNTTTLIKKCRAYYKEHPDASKGKIAKETGHSRYIVDLYWDYISKGVPYTKAHEGKAMALKEEKLNKKVISTDSPIVEVRYLEDTGWKRDYYGVVRCSDTHAYFFEGIPFSNWWTSEPYIEYDGKHFTSSEHLFMYFKAIHFGDNEIADKILRAKSYKQAKSLGRKVKNYTDAEWMRVGSDYMYKAVEAKYQSDKVFRDALMDDAYKGLTFVEASPFDNKWGIKRAATDDVVLGKKKWLGSNLLGQTLTRLRDNALVHPIEPYNLESESCPDNTHKDKEHLLPNAIIGACAGDIIGSRYESHRHRIYTTDFELFPKRSAYTDDTIHTIATMDWIMNDAEHTDRILCDMYYDYSYRNKFKGRFCVYGGDFKRWLERGEKELYRESDGNGSSMRVSPIGWAYDSIEDVEKVAAQTAKTTHNGADSIRGAQAIAVATLLARKGSSKEEIRSTIQERYGWDLTKTCSYWRERNRKRNEGAYNPLDVSGRMSLAINSVPPAILAFLESTDFESAIRLAVSVGGDSDTIAAMTGGIAEAAYGIPEHIRAVVDKKMKPQFIPIINTFTERYVK